MKSLAARRRRNTALLVVLATALLIACHLATLALGRPVIYTGWLLLAMVILLAGYNVRKRFAFLPLGSSANWLQLHIYVGLLTIVVFGSHIAWHVPNGVFDVVMASLYVLVAGSGVLGLIISRVFARRMTARGGEILFDRIPRRLGVLRREVERLVLAGLRETESTAISDFYQTRLQSFFFAPRNMVMHLVHSQRPRQALLSEIEAQRRYLRDDEHALLGQIADRVAQKDDLDYQFAHQATLKYWLFLHVPLTYALLVFSAVHVVMVHAF